MSLNKKTCQVCLEPYPDWSSHEECKPLTIKNAVDIVLDPLEILWVLDVGIVNTLEEPVQLSSPKIVAIDVKTGKVITNLHQIKNVFSHNILIVWNWKVN